MVSREPRSMTIADVLALTAGVAMSLAVFTSLPGLPFVRSPSDQLVFSMIRFLQGVALAVSAVTLARVGLYRRMPLPAEWLGILVGVSMLSDRPEWQVDRWTDWILWEASFRVSSLPFTSWRWVGAGVFTVYIVIIMGLLQLGRNRLPTWFKTILLAWVALLAMSGPLWVFSQHGADWISPSEGFGPGTASTLYRGACLLAASLPMGLLIGVPAVAALIERIAGRKWTWIEWAALSSSTMTGLASLMLYRGEFRTPSVAWLLERLIVLAWFLAVALLSRLILMRFGDGWGRWIDGPVDQNWSTPPGPDSPSSTR